MSTESTAAAQTDIPAPPANRRSPGIIWAVVLNLIVTAAMLYAYDTYYAAKTYNRQRVVAVDIVGYTKGVINATARGQMTQEQYKQSIDLLEETVRSAEKSNVVISADVLLGGAPVLKINNPHLAQEGGAK